MKSDLYSVPTPAGGAVSILGGHVGYAARAMCFVEDGSVIVVLTNRDDVGTEVAEPWRPPRVQVDGLDPTPRGHRSTWRYWRHSADPPVGPGVDDLATALADLAPFRVTSPPQDVTVDGYSGKHLELTVPDLPVDHEGFTKCVDLNLASWTSSHNGPPGDNAFYGYSGPGYSEEFWILDVEGTRLMIAAERSAGSPPGDLADQQAILDSIRIEP